MVKLFRPAFFVLAFAWGAAAILPAKEPADYKLGDRVEADIVTPVTLVVIDPEATVELKTREGERVPVIFRFYPQAGAEATAAFHKSFTETRGSFLDAVEQSFDARKLDADLLASEKFSRLIASFQKNNPSSPVTAELARRWAGGESGQEVEAPLLAGLDAQMKNFIRATNAVPEGAKVGATVRVVAYADTETLTAQMVARHGTNHPKTDFISFQRARTDLQAAFPPDLRAAAKYVGSFLKPNCSVEAELTLALRAKRTDGLSVTANFTNGQVIAKKGQVIDAGILAAIAALREKAPPVMIPLLPTPTGALPRARHNFWLFSTVAGGVLLVFGFTVLRRGRKPPATLLPARVDNTPPAAVPATGPDWQQRALAAEHQAAKAQTVIRQGLIAHLARWMSDTLVQKLLLQRSHLIETQQQAATDVDRLGQRLETIHSRMQGRLSVYEQRITELEKELDTKDEINRELIQAEIQKIRRQMDAERVRSEGGLN